MEMFNVLNRQQQPFINSGYGALSKLNTLLGLNARPGMAAPGMPPPSAPAYRPTPGGGVTPILQPGPSGPDVHLSDPIQPGGGTTALNRILLLRAMHGDTQAGQLLQRMGGG